MNGRPSCDRRMCGWCGEKIAPDEIRWGESSMHVECAARAILGSVGHLEGRCACSGGTEGDPPGLTKREAAKAAHRLMLGRLHGGA